MPELHAEQVFDSVFVVESLRPEDKIKTGSELHASFLSPLGRRARVQVSAPLLVSTVVDLRAALRAIEQDVARSRLSPILQLEAHGNRDGLQLGSGERVPWRQVGDWLEPINEASRNTLFVGSSMCHGAWMFRTLTHRVLVGRASLWGFAGATSSVTGHQLLKGFGEFYRVMMYDQDTTAAFQGLARELGEIAFLMAETILARAWQHLLKAVDADDDGSARALAIRFGLGDGAMPLGPERDTLLREIFARNRAHYLWLDLFPEQSRRFALTFDRLRSVNLGFVENEGVDPSQS